MFTFTLAMSLWLGIFLPDVAPAASKAPVPGAAETNTDKLTWSAARRLTWDDFKGIPDDANEHHALTAANLAVDARCSNNKLSYDVKCVFLPQESWSRNKKSEKLLLHEQLHFDLTEVHARLLRKKLRNMNSSCTNLQSNLNLAVKSAFQDWKEEQALFDQLSRHGLNKEEQKAWEKDIYSRLSALKAYSF
ncbi:DUF922 domain-containing protein [Pontibacter sp. MBLB2868]|uniref:DUF922 domain-containing protein n=1 Tax=Pontibacter sp. MBLB2868 TaxID=3451555 RepID=UPI003F755EA6